MKQTNWSSELILTGFHSDAFSSFSGYANVAPVPSLGGINGTVYRHHPTFQFKILIRLHDDESLRSHYHRYV